MMQTTKSLLETTLNTRELGGYRTKDGGYTPCHKLIRSDAPKKLSEKDMAYLLDRQIATVIDMRGEADVRKMPNPIRDNPQFRYYNIPIEEGSSIPESTFAVPDSYMKIAAAESMGQVFKQIALAPGGVLFHCSAGKDRTGVVSAILLLLAGVSDKDITENYMLTKEYNQKRFALARQNFPNIDINIVIPHEEYITQFLQLFREKYKDPENYLRSIGVLPGETGLLKSKLITLNKVK